MSTFSYAAETRKEFLKILEGMMESCCCLENKQHIIKASLLEVQKILKKQNKGNTEAGNNEENDIHEIDIRKVGICYFSLCFCGVSSHIQSQKHCFSE
jgi:hypothetical protein